MGAARAAIRRHRRLDAFAVLPPDAALGTLLFHALFLFCCASLMLGWRTRLGQMGGADRADLVRPPQSDLGLRRRQDPRLAAADPVRRADRARASASTGVRAVRAAKRADLAAIVPLFSSPWANACTRLMQIQMAVLFFYSAHRTRSAATTGGTATPSGWSSPPTSMYNGFLLEPVRPPVLAGQCRDLSDAVDRDRVSVPDLAARSRGPICWPRRCSCTRSSPPSWGCRISPLS